MREMGNAGDEFVVGRGGEPGDAAADGFPEELEFPAELLGGLLIVGHQAGGVFEKGGQGSLDATAFGAGHRVAADEGNAVGRKKRRKGGVDHAFHATDVGDQRVRAETGEDRFRDQVRHRPDWHRENDEIRAVEGLPQIGGRPGDPGTSGQGGGFLTSRPQAARWPGRPCRQGQGERTT
jgi:hypothetical protein